MSTKRIEAGEIVVYTLAFLRNTGQTLGDAPRAEARVEERVDIGGEEYLRVLWSDEPSDRTVLVRASNVCRRGALASFEVVR